MKGLCIENFKCFEGVKINFSNLTILAGNNGAGKSTVIQAILLLIQSYEKNDPTIDLSRLYINDYYCELGSSKRLLYRDAHDDFIRFTFIDIEGNYKKLKCSIDQKDFNIFNIVNSESATKEETDNNALSFITYFDFIGADRFGPKIFHHTDSNFSRIKVGKYGEYTTLVLDKYKHELLPQSTVFEDKPATLLSHVNHWLSEIFGFIQVETTFLDEANMAMLKIKNHPFGDYENPVNMPYGVSYVLPIIVSCLVRQIPKEKLFDNYVGGNVENEMVIIENPEAHLHPAAQSRLGEFISIMSNTVQIIVETHSDHIINGIRKAVKNKLLSSDSVLINTFNLEQDSVSSVVDEIKIGSNGEVSKWPEGFFDQFEKDLLELM